MSQFDHADASNDNSQRTADHWSENTAESEAFADNTYWLAIPPVQRRHQSKATQGEDVDWAHYFLERYFPNRQGLLMASIGCGSGGLERALASWNAFSHCDAYDIAPGAIKLAKQHAADAGFTQINYEVRDINSLEWPSDHYDAVWFNGSLHHIEQLERVYQQVSHTLKPGGYLFFNEYIGPSRFDFTERQKQVMDAVFKLLPQRFKRSFIPNYPHPYLQATPIPDPVEVQRVDPSEAVRSDEIMSILPDYFDILEFNKMGGTILQFLLAGIAGNFHPSDKDAMRMLDMLFAIEDTLIDIGDIQSDFACVAATPKKK
ncbi:MAG: SAM-dependent methyltransferase [Anaerolineaceae bacterium]|nr:SAM-dependent methyltransferase [Anaerolineaceae bacterium]